MSKKWMKLLLTSSTLLLLTACGTEKQEQAKSNMGKEFVAMRKQERTVDEKLYRHYVDDLVAQYNELEAEVRAFEESGASLSEGEKDELGLSAEFFVISLENFHDKSPGTDEFKKSEKSLFAFLTLAEEVANELIAISNTNGIDSLGGVNGTLAKIERPKQIWQSKYLEDLGYPAEIQTEEEVAEQEAQEKAAKKAATEKK